ncbi:hypothetical protein JL790_12050 [Staphylococcus pseudintermedius]|nr:hypothetical protein [Staphylococcus pseudintermedius]MCE5670044.1 hypothetical protein [Staphylococcus pseudintermedius]MCE5747407.1 hypothetical protein [Staphylococcus pseudintermedius]MCE5784027.1 hypothetical protein [Staphylococcus pseudintermedius]MCE5791097.1 hypothetical protein [Staphylococcus pseudintermedius]
MRKLIFNKTFLLALSLIVTFFGIFNTPAQAESNSINKEQINTIQNSLKYDIQNEKYVFNTEYATSNGLTQKQAENLKNYFESMNKDQIEKFNQEIGFKPDLNSSENEGTSTRIAPALAAVLGVIGGAVATKLLDEIMNYGIAKTCQVNEGKWKAFDDYCSTNGHL